MSTFKIPHALAALDAGVLTGADEVIRYDGRAEDADSARRDHTLATAMKHSVVWYFQRIAERLGSAREADYLNRLDYGNADSSSHLTSFWLYESLLVSPEEQQRFLVRLYEDTLPVSHEAQATVRRILIQARGSVTNAAGTHPFAPPWPEGTVVSAKTGSGSRPDRPDVRWLVGNVTRRGRSWIFVSSVVGDGLAPLAAIDLAARSLKAAGVL
jgi:beta-lactamase class D